MLFFFYSAYNDFEWFIYAFIFVILQLSYTPLIIYTPALAFGQGAYRRQIK